MLQKARVRFTFADQRIQFLTRIALVMLCMALALPALTNAWQAVYSRYAADDYQFAFQTRSRGFIQNQVNFYQTWSGRYAFAFTVCLLVTLGRQAVPFIILGILLLFLIGWFFVFRQVGLVLKFESANLIALLLVLLFAFVFFDQLPNLQQVLFWITGNSNYFAPYIPFALALLIVLIQISQPAAGPGRAWPGYILLFMLVFWIGGYTEVLTAAQIVFWGALFILSWLFAPQPLKKRLMGCLFTASAAAVLAALVVYVAPGNKIRQATEGAPPAPDFINLLRMSVAFTLQFLKEQLSAKPVFFSSAIFLPFLAVALGGRVKSQAGEQASRRTAVVLYALLIIPILGLALVFSSFVAPAWALSSYPYARILTTSYFFYTLTLVAWGAALGLALRSVSNHSFYPVLLAGLLLVGGVILLLGPVRSAYRQVKINLPVAQQFAAAWDQRDAVLTRAAARGVKSIAVPETVNYYDLAQLMPITPTRVHWINLEMASYYRIDSIDLQK